jgi:hypothetical protein
MAKNAINLLKTFMLLLNDDCKWKIIFKIYG